MGYGNDKYEVENDNDKDAYNEGDFELVYELEHDYAYGNYGGDDNGVHNDMDSSYGGEVYSATGDYKYDNNGGDLVSAGRELHDLENGKPLLGVPNKIR